MANSNDQVILRSVNELRMRRTVCDQCMRVLISECADDPRQPGALEHYRQQLQKLDAELAEAEHLERKRLGILEPEPIVIGLKPGHLLCESRS